jgi:hypothetical protein
MNQHEYVEACQTKYRFESIPEGEVWHDAHYPLPSCLGGTETVTLWESDHAVQGVLQSENLQHPCIFGWEKKYLPEDLLPLFAKWRSILSQGAAAASNGSRTSEERVAMATAASLAAKEKFDQLTPEEKSAWGKRASRAAYDVMTPGQLTARGHKGGSEAQKRRTPEQVKKWHGKGAETQHKIRVKCLVTGYVSTPCGLTHYQKARDIDTSLRERIN